ncbi:hypothetical protein HYN59_01440 [Flavobacterium album]|uniref:Addiction module protein n=1 Tax=Flavobacterium album TaxID=2175091 RepID=A0A2S1QU49_9FLAO|nr:hypothetical protein [Flavobacterium album]AWH83859.1 hypothetical protein HYN59_01440 [Flavobacterium album]
MDINAAKIELIQIVLDLDDAELIVKAIQFLKNEQTDFYDELSEDEKLEIQYGLEQLDRGERISWEDFKERRLKK